MNRQRSFFRPLKRLLVALILISPSQILLAADDIKTAQCIDRASERIMEIRALPEKTYLQTLDGQEVLLREFSARCLHLFPNCVLFEKFYYWPSEIREVTSTARRGMVTHKIKCYHNCLSVFCSGQRDTQKTHGDVAEYYDEQGNFMGLSVYMGNGKYCPLPYSGYGNQILGKK